MLKQARSNFYKVGFTSRSVADRIKTASDWKSTKNNREKFSETVTDVGQAEKAVKTSVKEFNIRNKYQGGTEWYEVPEDKCSTFKTSIERAIGHFHPKNEQ